MKKVFRLMYWIYCWESFYRADVSFFNIYRERKSCQIMGAASYLLRQIDREIDCSQNTERFGIWSVLIRVEGQISALETGLRLFRSIRR
jgi:hypothetical protein